MLTTLLSVLSYQSYLKASELNAKETIEQEVQNVYTPIEGAETSSTPSTAAGSISMTEIGADSKN